MQRRCWGSGMAKSAGIGILAFLVPPRGSAEEEAVQNGVRSTRGQDMTTPFTPSNRRNSCAGTWTSHLVAYCPCEYRYCVLVVVVAAVWGVHTSMPPGRNRDMHNFRNENAKIASEHPCRYYLRSPAHLYDYQYDYLCTTPRS